MTNMAKPKIRIRQYNIAEAKARLPSLVRETLSGAEVIIAKDNKPLVKLVPLSTPSRRLDSRIGERPDLDIRRF